jgi:hypothetical protein
MLARMRTRTKSMSKPGTQRKASARTSEVAWTVRALTA